MQPLEIQPSFAEGAGLFEPSVLCRRDRGGRDVAAGHAGRGAAAPGATGPPPVLRLPHRARAPAGVRRMAAFSCSSLHLHAA